MQQVGIQTVSGYGSTELIIGLAQADIGNKLWKIIKN